MAAFAATSPAALATRGSAFLGSSASKRGSNARPIRTRPILTTR